jgi:hypothetical protein
LYTFIVLLAAVLSFSFFMYGKWLQYSFHCMTIQYSNASSHAAKSLPTNPATDISSASLTTEYSVSLLLYPTLYMNNDYMNFEQWIGFFVAKEACLCSEFLSFELFLWFSFLVTLFFTQLFVLQLILVARETTLNNVSTYTFSLFSE